MPTKSKVNNPKRKIIYVFQGGGALGSFQVGGVEALYEHGYRADMLVGISIGGINAAIMAGNPPEQRIQKLKQFWHMVTQPQASILPSWNLWAKVHNFWGAMTALVGNPHFYTQRLINPFFIPTPQTPDQLSFYDTTPLRDTLQELIDFDYLNQGHVQLCLGTTDLASGDFVFFDNTQHEIRVEHIMASGALPPGFPAVEIDGRYYVDGGVYANTPLSKVLDEFAIHYDEKRCSLCFMFDLFSANGPLPHSMDGMLERVKDIQYSSHSKRNGEIYATTQNLSHAIKFLGSKLPAALKNDPQVKEILKLGTAHRLDLVHVIYHSPRGTELNSKDYNFSRDTAVRHWQQGYKITSQLIEEKHQEWDKHHLQGATVYTMDGDKTITTAI